MRPFSAFSAKGEWFRGNCHTHTVLSDGKETAEALVEAYRKKGYDFLVFTDHDKCQDDVTALQRKGFLVINGVELHPPTRSPVGGGHHIVAIGVEKSPPRSFRENGSARSVISWIHRNGGMAIYGHPYWTGHDIENMKEGRAALGVEVFNAVCANMRGLGDSSVHLDQALSRGFRWTVFATDDVHMKKRDAFGGWIVVKANTLSRRAVMNAIRKGRFYASTGPEIRSLSLKRGVARIVCSPVRKIVWHSEGPGGTRMASQGKPLTTGEFSVKMLGRRYNYLRVEIIDAKGRKAWSNPVRRNRKTGRWED